jgi:hypothetical protein
MAAIVNDDRPRTARADVYAEYVDNASIGNSTR